MAKDSSGFSLAEIMVALGLLSIITLALVKGLGESHRIKDESRNRAVVDQTVSKVTAYTEDSVQANVLLSSLSKTQVTAPTGKDVASVVDKDGNTLSLTVSDAKGNPITKEIKTATEADRDNHLIPGKLYIEKINLQYKKKFSAIEDSSTNVVENNEHGVVHMGLTFAVGVGANKRRLKKTIPVNVIYKQTGSFSKALSKVERISKVIEDEVCKSTYEGVLLGSYEEGSCKDYINKAGHGIQKRACKELGLELDASGKCKISVFPSGVSSCPSGITGFDADGNAICK